MTRQRPFDKQGEFTVFDNIILDYIMPRLKPNAWKCLCFIIRKTVGWQKTSDEISFSQIKAGTGISSYGTIADALKQLEEAGFILVKRYDDQWESNRYALNTSLEIEVEPATETVVDEWPTTEIVAVPTTEIVAVPTTKTVNTKERKKRKKKDSHNQKPIDYLETVVNNLGQVSEESASPTDQWLTYRDEAIRIFDDKSGAWGRTPQERQTRRERVGELAGRPDFDPVRWERSITESINAGVNAANINRFIEVYELGGSYQAYLNKQYPGRNGNGNATNGTVIQTSDGGYYV